MACQHRACDCREDSVVRGGKRYCSDRCADAEATERQEPRCPCGHTGCGATAGDAGRRSDAPGGAGLA